MPSPIIELEGGEQAVVIRRDVPEPVSYQGKNFIELDFRNGSEETDDESIYTEEAFITQRDSNSTRRMESRVETSIIREANLTLNIGSRNNFILSDTKSKSSGANDTLAPPDEDPQNPTDPLGEVVKPGYDVYMMELVDGSPGAHVAPTPVNPPVPRIYLVETYRLSTNLGDYGAGRIVKTFSLLPGEKTKISLRTFRRSEELRKSSSSILDSVTSESAREFQNSIESEQSDKGSYEKTFEYHAEAEAKASWGFGSAKVSGGVKGSTNAAREEFSKNINRATEQHAAKASAKREVEINTSTEVTDSVEEEQSIEKEIQNINVGSALNFVFRQMNQEFFSLLHLVDVRVAFFNGYRESRMEVPLYNLETLLDRFVLPPSHAIVRTAIQDSLQTILNHNGESVENFVVERTLPDSAPFLRVNTELVSTFRDPIGGAEFRVPGVITNASRNVMRTEGVMVEAFLGDASALDDYATRLQELEIERREVDTARQAAEVSRIEIGNQFAENEEIEKAGILANLQSSVRKHESSDEDDS